MNTMPVLFVGHGSPMNALEKNLFTQTLSDLGNQLPKPQAILCVSAHWETQGTQILNSEKPSTIHDFHGFPQALFDVEYPCPGAVEFAQKTQTLIPGSILTEKWGLDHGTWSILVHMFPKADIPTYQLSLDISKTTSEHLETGRALQALRNEGVLILGSGNIVHNLRMLEWRNPNGAAPWAISFDNYIKKCLENRDSSALCQFDSFGAEALKSVPTLEHYLPLLSCFGASQESDRLSFPFEGFAYGSLSMRTALWS